MKTFPHPKEVHDFLAWVDEEFKKIVATVDDVQLGLSNYKLQPENSGGNPAENNFKNSGAE